MQKQVILDEEEYHRLCTIAALALQLNDKYVVEKSLPTKHIVDTISLCDPVQRALFMKLMYTGQQGSDITSLLPKGYVIPTRSAMYDGNDGNSPDLDEYKDD